MTKLYNPVFGYFSTFDELLGSSIEAFNAHCRYNNYNIAINATGVGYAWQPQGVQTSAGFVVIERAGEGLFWDILTNDGGSSGAGDYVAAVFDTRATSMARALVQIWRVGVWLRGSFPPAFGKFLGNVEKVDLVANPTFSRLLAGVQAGIRGNPELALMSQGNLYILPDEDKFQGWQVFTKNADIPEKDGSFLSVGASYGVQAPEAITWHPEYGLLCMRSAIMPDVDRDGDAILAAVMVLAVVCFIYIGGALAGVWGDAAAAPVVEGAALGAEESIIVAGTDTASSFAVVDTTSMVGTSTLTFGEAATYAGYASTAAGALDSGGGGGSDVASQQVPQTISSDAELADTVDKFFSMNTLTDATKIAQNLNTIYKVVKKPDGSSQLVLRSNTAPTYGQVATGNYSTSGFSVQSVLPFAAIAVAAIVGTS